MINDHTDKVLVTLVIAMILNGVLMYRNEGVTVERMDAFDREILRLTEGQQALLNDQRELERVVYQRLPQGLLQR